MKQKCRNGQKKSWKRSNKATNKKAINKEVIKMTEFDNTNIEDMTEYTAELIREING